MILHNFECTSGHIFEAMIEAEAIKEPIQCRFKGEIPCEAPAEVVYLSPRKASNALRFEPTLLYKNANGEVIAPGRSNPEHLPKEYRDRLAKQGFKPLQINNFRQYESFIREQRSRANDDRERFISEAQDKYDKELNSQIEAFKRGDILRMPVVRADGSIDYEAEKTLQVSLDSLSPRMRELAEYSIERAKQYRIRDRVREANPHIEAFERDGTSYCDVDTNWRNRR